MFPNNSNILEKIDELTNDLVIIEKKFGDYYNQVNNSIKTQSELPNHINLNIVNIFEGIIATSLDESTSILLFVRDNIKLEKFLNKLSLELDELKINFIKKTFEILAINDNSSMSLLKNLLDKIKNFLSKGNLLLEDIPNLINIIGIFLNLNLSNLKNKMKSKIKINAFLFSLIVKLIVCISIELKIISIGNLQIENFIPIINSSLLLLHTIVDVPNIAKTSFCCWK